MPDIPVGTSLMTHVWLASQLKKNKRQPTLRDILDDMLSVFDVQENEVINARRYRKYVRYRQLFIWVATQITDETCVGIGRFLGYDHTSVIHHRELVKGWIEVEDEFFMQLFDHYRAESKIYYKHFKK